MERRTFIKNTALFAVAISATGFIRFDGSGYIGDCETTTDILGPFYRPDSPVRNNLTAKGAPGSPIELSGTIRHKDCISPCKKAKIELWHCSSTGEYDNTSDQFLYRGTTFTDDEGKYFFNTVLPVPYDVGGGIVRPAHFHIMITAPGYQPLVTQLYFSGDPNIPNDPSSASPKAKRRILDVQTLTDGSKKVTYDVGISDTLEVGMAALNSLTGVYTDEKDKNKKVELFKKDHSLWIKNEVFGLGFEYIGNNTFQYPGTSVGESYNLHFDILASGSVKLTETLIEGGQKKVSVSLKKK